MIVSDINTVTILVILLFAAPILWIAHRNELLKDLSFFKLIYTLNKALIIQGIIGLILVSLSWIWNTASLGFDSLITGTSYTYLVIGFFMYLPALGILNLINFVAQKKTRKENVE